MLVFKQLFSFLKHAVSLYETLVYVWLKQEKKLFSVFFVSVFLLMVHKEDLNFICCYKKPNWVWCCHHFNCTSTIVFYTTLELSNMFYLFYYECLGIFLSVSWSLSSDSLCLSQPVSMCSCVFGICVFFFFLFLLTSLSLSLSLSLSFSL